MKPRLLLLVAILVFFAGTSAQALPVFSKTFREKYAGEGADPEFETRVDAAKCNVCHAGPVKAIRNDYGKALEKHLDKNDFKAAALVAAPDAAKKRILDALKKVEIEMSPAGETYGERLRAGKLPSTK